MTRPAHQEDHSDDPERQPLLESTKNKFSSDDLQSVRPILVGEELNEKLSEIGELPIHVNVSEADYSESESPGRRVFLFSLRLAYAVLTMCGMVILLRMWGIAAPHYSWFYSMSWALGFTFFFFLLFLMKRFTGRSTMPPAALDSWKPVLKQSVFTGFLYAVNYFGISTGNPHISGPVEIILSQFPLVVTLLLSRVLFRRRYTLRAWFGAALTVTGAVLSMVIGSKSNAEGTVGYFLLFLLGNVPLGVLPVCFELFYQARHRLDGRQVTVEWRMMWTNIFVAIWLLLFLPLFMAFGQPPFGHFSENMHEASRCVFHGENPKGSSFSALDSYCIDAGWILGLTLIVAAAQAHSQVLLSRHESGAAAAIALSIAPFLADGVFPVLPAPYHQSVHWIAGVAGGICLIGAILFTVDDSKVREKYPAFKFTGFDWFFKTGKEMH